MLALLSQEQAQTVIEATVGVLALGNTRFKEKAGASEVDAAGTCGLDDAARLWGVDPAALTRACHCFPVAGQARACSVEQSSNQRDAIARAVYKELWGLILTIACKKLKRHPDCNIASNRFVGVLDCPGFTGRGTNSLLPERGEVLNGLSAMHANYCEELIHSHYVLKEFTWEEEGLKEQLGAGVVPVEEMAALEQSAVVCRLLGGHKESVAARLTEASNHRGEGGASSSRGDQDFHLLGELGKWVGALHKGSTSQPATQSLHMAPSSYKGRLEERGADVPCGFTVRHYARDVLYDLRGW
jgi:hypothetical protein